MDDSELEQVEALVKEIRLDIHAEREALRDICQYVAEEIRKTAVWMRDQGNTEHKEAWADCAIVLERCAGNVGRIATFIKDTDRTSRERVQ